MAPYQVEYQPAAAAAGDDDDLSTAKGLRVLAVAYSTERYVHCLCCSVCLWFSITDSNPLPRFVSQVLQRGYKCDTSFLSCGKSLLILY